MKITVNGREHSVDQSALTVADAVDRFGGGDPSGRGVAVAVNGEVVPRLRWPDKPLESGDRVEILRAVGGG